MRERLRDRLEAMDPGHIRLSLALRTTGAIAASFLVLTGVRLALHWPLVVPLFGAVLAMSWNVTVNDPEPEARRRTTLLLWLPTALTASLGALTRRDPIASDLAFLAILFVAFFIRVYGPRWIAVGFLAVFGFFLTWFLQAEPGQIPELLFALAVTTATTYVFRFVILPDRPEAAVRHGLRAFRARTRLIAGAVIAAEEAGGWTSARRRQLLDHLYRLNYTALVLDDVLRDAADVGLRAAILEAEIAVEALAEAALAGAGANRVAAALRETADELRHLMARARATSFARSDWAPRPGFRIGTTIDTGRVPAHLRQALQVTVAAAVAIAAGEALSATRWYWAVLAAFIVFAGSSSAGETLNKAWGRSAGTVLGILAGIGVERLVRGQEALELALIFVFLFAAVYVFRIWYAGMIFFITAVLSLMYGLLGMFSDQLLFLRLIETVAGALVGSLAALVVLPLRTERVMGNVNVEALVRLRTVVDAAVDRILGRSREDLIANVRAFDESLQTVRLQIRATVGPRLAGDTVRRARLAAIAACGYYARNLVAVASAEPPPSPGADLDARRARLDARIDRLIAALRGTRSDRAEPPDPVRPPVGDEPGLYLYRLNRTLRHLARVLALERGDGGSLDPRAPSPLRERSAV